MFALKLALVAASILLATLAARRYGHGVSGTLGGMPMIAGPIMGFVLVEQSGSQVRAIALATLVCVPAMVLHMVSFAHAARRLPWYGALLLANTVFVASGWALSRLALPPAVVGVAALLAPLAGIAALRRLDLRSGGAAARGASVATAAGVAAGGVASGLAGGLADGLAGGVAGGAMVAIAHRELVLRVFVAVLLAAAIMQGAARLPAIVSGLLLALPITGNVLPCFTLPRHGAAATAALLRGFLSGVFGFASFFVTLAATLPRLAPGFAYALAWCAAVLVALSVYRTRSRLRAATAAAA